MLGLGRKKACAVLLGCASSVVAPAAFAQTIVDCTELEADPATYGTVIYGVGGSAATATFGRIASYLAGLPAMSIPCGFLGGLPVGLQVIGPHFAEGKLLNVAHRYQQETQWHKEIPANYK